jgi:hypothetical protein
MSLSPSKKRDTRRVGTCIYCLERKPDADFNREHVMLDAFGKFEGNLVLDCVCKACNDYFSKHVDLKFARDSVEGFFRFAMGIKSTAEYKSLGPRSTMRVEFREGDSIGAIGYITANKDGGPELGVDFAPYFGFSATEDGPKTWFSSDALPTRDRLPEHGFGTCPFFLHIRGMFVEHAEAVLEAKGYRVTNGFRTWFPEDQRVATTAVGIIGPAEMRAAAKITMNYLAFIGGPGLVRSCSSWWRSPRAAPRARQTRRATPARLTPTLGRPAMRLPRRRSRATTRQRRVPPPRCPACLASVPSRARFAPTATKALALAVSVSPRTLERAGRSGSAYPRRRSASSRTRCAPQSAHR